jgi:hypothetical protein
MESDSRWDEVGDKPRRGATAGGTRVGGLWVERSVGR